MAKRPNMADQIRRAFKDTGWSIKKLSGAAGVPYAACHGFVTGDRMISVLTVDRLCRALRLELRSK